MVEPAYSDERAEAFLAYMRLYGYKAAIDRCDWVAARRWFYEKEGERSRATARRALFCVAFATAYMVLHISMPQLVEEVPRPLRNVMDAVALTSVFAGALTLLRFKEETFDDMPPSIRDVILSHFFMSDVEIAEIEAEKEQNKRSIERSRFRLRPSMGTATSQDISVGIRSWAPAVRAVKSRKTMLIR